MATVVIPDPQARYLEPFKNRLYQYDNKHSNLFLSRYVNNILRAVGNDVIVRGLQVTPTINESKTGIDFKIFAGSLIQDLTYIELPLDTKISIDNITSFSNQKIILYTSWRHLDVVYENPLKIEVTLYDPITENTLTRWNSVTNRIILGIYDFEVENNVIINIKEDLDLSNIVLIESNTIRNSTFDTKTTAPWIPINSELFINEIGGINDTPCCVIQPIGGDYQGIAQSVVVKKDVEHRCSFYVRGVTNIIPFTVKIIDGNNIYLKDPITLASISRQAGLSWTKYEFVFKPISPDVSFILLKTTTDTDNFNIELDNVYIVQYSEARKATFANIVNYIDGGIL